MSPIDNAILFTSVCALAIGFMIGFAVGGKPSIRKPKTEDGWRYVPGVGWRWSRIRQERDRASRVETDERS